MKAILLAATLSLALVSTAHAQSLPAEPTQLGIIAGMPYAKAKRLLDAAGWQVKSGTGRAGIAGGLSGSRMPEGRKAVRDNLREGRSADRGAAGHYLGRAAVRAGR
jgi:hypothetical protein